MTSNGLLLIVIIFVLLKECVSYITIQYPLPASYVNIFNTSVFEYTISTTSFSSSNDNDTISLSLNENSLSSLPQWIKITRNFDLHNLGSVSGVHGSQVEVPNDQSAGEYSSFLYVCGENGFIVLNTTNQSDPRVIGSTTSNDFITFKNFSKFSIDELSYHAFVANGPGGIQILDIRNPTEYNNHNITIVGNITTFDARSVVVKHHMAYIADFTNGISLWNVSNVTNPVFVSNWFSGQIMTYDVKVVVSEEERLFLYTCCGSLGLRIYDVSDPYDVFLITMEIMTISSCRSLISGFNDSRYMLYLYDDLDDRVYIIDISNQSNPVTLSYIELMEEEEEDENIIDFSVSWDETYIVLITDLRSLKFVSILNKKYPYIINRDLDFSSYYEGIVIDGDFVYCVGGDQSDLRIIKTESLVHGYLTFTSNSLVVPTIVDNVCGGNVTVIVNVRSSLGAKEEEFYTTTFDICFLGDGYVEPPGYCSEGRGVCEYDSFTCRCLENLYGSYCEVSKCYDYYSNQTKEVCSGKGMCQIDGTCVCDEEYTGDDCESWNCFNISREEVDIVCGGHGSCLKSDSCLCFEGYNSQVPFGKCTEYYCGLYFKDEDGGCNSRGICTAAETCVCDEGFEGKYCDTWSCGFDKDDPFTCNGHGECVSPNFCECDESYGGELCGSFTAYAAIFFPVGFLGAFVFCCVVCGCYACSILFITISIAFCEIVFVYLLWLWGQVRRFRKLKNFDILLSEQRSEDNVDIANIRVKKNLYTIDFDEIRIDELLGEGGSASVIYKVFWKNQDAAFKCFKTRLVCQSQDKFNDFEKEVELFSSLRHPHIVRFFGATLNPPRVGIIMEYCERGDLTQFLKEYRNNHEEYPLEEKIRMCLEITSCMLYLHSRKILHRDLKLENVLVDEKYATKLMDFGLSKIVERMSKVRTSKIGTNIYMAPEVAASDRYSEKCDVFSFSILVFVLITENFNPYGSVERMVELKVSSDPNYRPNINELNSKLAAVGGGLPSNAEWISDMVVRNWGHDEKGRNSFRDLNEMFKEYIEKCLSSKKEQDGTSSNQQFNGPFVWKEGEKEHEFEIDGVYEEELLKKWNEFEDGKGFLSYLRSEIESYKVKISEYMDKRKGK